MNLQPDLQPGTGSETWTRRLYRNWTWNLDLVPVQWSLSPPISSESTQTTHRYPWRGRKRHEREGFLTPSGKRNDEGSPRKTPHLTYTPSTPVTRPEGPNRTSLMGRGSLPHSPSPATKLHQSIYSGTHLHPLKGVERPPPNYIDVSRLLTQ